MNPLSHPAREPETKLTRLNQRADTAFSRVDLLVVVGVIMILAALWMPALARTGGNDRSFQCLNNLRSLMGAMLMYTHDYHDVFPPNSDDTLEGLNWCQGGAGIGQDDEFNSDLLKNPTRSLLATYIATNITLFRCPSDNRMGRSTAASTRGQVVPAARSISMNAAVGTLASQLPVNGPWLDGNHTHTRNGPWFTYGKTTAIFRPPPAMLFVLLDENPRSINDACFAMSMVGSRFVDAPGSFHNFGCSMAFADGHCDINKWRDARTSFVTGSVTYSPPNPDVAWVQERTTALK